MRGRWSFTAGRIKKTSINIVYLRLVFLDLSLFVGDAILILKCISATMNLGYLTVVCFSLFKRSFLVFSLIGKYLSTLIYHGLLGYLRELGEASIFGLFWASWI